LAFLILDLDFLINLNIKMSEVVDIAANGVENVSVITPVKSIIITKSIKSLTTNQSATATSPTALAEK
jgi:hypothetical protein